ncbi:flavin reductase family protein [Streptomyces hydrogenans]|uniref:flavin reductase family protein n=1 Tax=Streptomyces hydrogenans TaxID=1873719 RepID=UPI0033BF115C
MTVTGRSQAAPRRPDAHAFRGALSRFATGVVVVTGLTGADARPVGLTVNSFTSVSLDPPLVSFCAGRTSRTWPVLRDSERICVNILGARQEATSRALARSGPDKFAGVPWSPSPSGQPVLDGSIAWLECSVEAEHPAGDHHIVVARAHLLATADGDGPLLYHRSTYGHFVPTPTPAPPT